MAAQMSDAARRLGRRNAVIVLAMVTAVLIGTVCLLKLALGLAWNVAWLSSWAFWLAYLLALQTVCWFRGRAAAGPVLVDCGTGPRGLRAPIRLLATAVFGVLVIWTGAVAIEYWIHGKPDGAVENALGGLFFASLLATIPSSGRLQLRQNGIWFSGSLLRWDRIKSYHWEGQDSLTLMIEYAGRFPLCRQRTILVPAEHKEKFEQALSEYCTCSTTRSRRASTCAPKGNGAQQTDEWNLAVREIKRPGQDDT